MTRRPAKQTRQQNDHSGRRMLTVSNRGPVEFHRDEEGKVIAVPGQGGLATALRVAAHLHPTTWLSSPLTEVDRLIAAGRCAPAEFEGVSHFVLTDPAAYDLFYASFSNEALWFLQHSLPWPEELDDRRMVEAWEDGYLAVNRAFAAAVAQEIDSGDFRAVIFHDYHFYVAPRFVRDMRPDAYLQHFVHVPWPASQEWGRLERPVLSALLDGLLANDSLVFQTPGDVRNFLQTVKACLPRAAVDVDAGQARWGGRLTRVWANGISVDPQELDAEKASPEFSRYRWLLRADPGHQTIVRVDRLDLTKNAVRGFQAYERLFELHPELRGRIEFLALLVPSKSDIAAYRRYQDETHALADSINKRLGNRRWKPIRLIFEHNRVQALAAMSLYDVLLVNAVADGMNLVAKEGPMLNMHDGVLVLSKRAGAYAELSAGAIGIDPEDVEGTAEALYAGLTLPAAERRERAIRLRALIRRHDLRDWFGELLKDIEVNAPAAATSAA